MNRDSLAGPWPAEVAHLPVCPHRRLPIPFIAEVGSDGTGHFTILDDDRKRECLERRLCAMCGLPMGGEIAFLGDVLSLRPGGFWIEPPVHERCAEIAIGGLCPFMSRQRVPRRPPEDDAGLIGITPDEVAAVGRSAPKRPWVMAVSSSYTPALTPTQAGPLTMVYLSGPLIRVRRYAWNADGRLTEVHTVRSQPRRKSRSARRSGS